MIKQLLNAQNLAEARAKLYQLLAAVYLKPPDVDFLKLLAVWVSSSVRNEDASQLLSEPMRRSLAMLDSFFEEKREGSWEELEENASIEFTRLFRAVKRRYSPLPPYESLYRGESARVFDDVTVDVLRGYHRYGLELTSSLSGEPPDHISFELEFMSFLCNREVEAWDKDNEDEALGFARVQKDFLAEHLLAWIPGFSDKIREYDQLGLFRGLADLTESWVTFDYQEHLQEI